MTHSTSVRQSRFIAEAVPAVFAAALSLPLPQLYCRRYGPMPPIVDVHDQQGPWNTPGQSRILVLADGGRMREQLLSIEPPHRFANRLTVLSGPFRPLVAVVEESWSFQSLGERTEATWEWNLYPRSRLAALVVPVVGRLWRGYARGVLEQLASEVHR